MENSKTDGNGGDARVSRERCCLYFKSFKNEISSTWHFGGFESRMLGRTTDMLTYVC